MEILDFDGATYDRIRAEGYEVELGRTMLEVAENPFTEQEVVDLCRNADGILLSSGVAVTRRLLQQLPKLRIVSKYGIGTEKIDVDAATELGILVGHTPVPGNFHSVAEHAIMLMLALVRQLRRFEDHLHAGGWRGPDTIVGDLRGKTIGLLGFGRTGREVASRLRGWHVRVVAHDPYVERSAAEELDVELVPLEELLGESDIVSCHLVVTPETTRLLDAERLALMKPTVILINTARGEVIDEAALHQALVSGRLAGAGLDVFDPEPPKRDNPLLELENVIATPHVAGFSEVSLREIVDLATDNVLAGVAGNLPESVKNPEAVPAWRERLDLLA